MKDPLLTLFVGMLPLSMHVHVKAQKLTSIVACDLLYNCTTCLDDGLGCVFAAGECSRECTQGNQGASCYSAITHPDLDTKGICNLYGADNLQCQAQTSCQACVATLKSDRQSCQWYPTVRNNLGACFGGGTGPFGSGEITCSVDSLDNDDPSEAPSPAGSSSEITMTPTAAVPAPTNPPIVETTITPTTVPTTETPTIVTVTPTTVTPSTSTPTTATPTTSTPTTGNVTITPTTPPTLDAGSLCQEASSDCQTCLETNCSWFPNVPLCAPNCSTEEDSDCYSTDDFANATQTCLVASTAAADREICFAQDSCETCLATLQSNGSSCQWYTNQEVSWCSTGGCDTNGVCGTTTCDIDETTNNGTQGELPSDNGTTIPTTPTTTNDTPSTTPIEDGPCTSWSTLNAAGGCLACLSSPDKCAWSVDTCLSSCDSIADAPCFSADPSQTTNNNRTVPEMCEMALVQEQEALTCSRKQYCTTCTSTFLSNGIDKCAWYRDDVTNTEWCGRGGCDRNGICGSSDQTACPQFPTDPPFSSSPAIDLTFRPTMSGTADKQEWMGMWPIPVIMLVFW
jgi:hypothetical protein